MPKYEELNGTQQELYGKLQAAMEEHKNIIDLLTGFSKEDLLKILTTVKCIEFEDGQEHTLTPLAYAINLKNSLNSKRYITNILSVAKEKDILEEVLTTADIKIKLSNGQEYTSTPLVHAIILNKQRGIQAILNLAKRNSILEKVLTTANIKIRSSGNHEYTLTPLTYAINLTNQEASQKSIKAIIDVAQDNDMLKKVFASIKDDPNKIEMHDRVEEICKKQEQEDWKVTLERIVPNHENQDKCEIFSKIFNEETFKVSLDSQRNADMITLIRKNQPDYESKKQSLVDESSIPKTEGNITKDTVKTTNKPIIIGSVCGSIAALAVGLGLYFGAALPILTMIGIAMAAALVTGLVAGGITYVISKPSENLDRVNVGQGVVDTGVNITA
ncbi:MAG: magnesium transporter [Wolbachia endosymbiont of Ephestia elutella]|uniref:Magnesium transporter n=1 Tax=Wolbachia endosymbiont of Ephestia elutella TaxID=3231696 RepID=A0AAU8MIR8_9RICK